MFRLLSGAEKFEDEDGWDGNSDPLGLINSQYGDEIEAIRQQCDEKQMQKKHIKDLTEKVRSVLVLFDCNKHATWVVGCRIM